MLKSKEEIGTIKREFANYLRHGSKHYAKTTAESYKYYVPEFLKIASSSENISYKAIKKIISGRNPGKKNALWRWFIFRDIDREVYLRIAAEAKESMPAYNWRRKKKRPKKKKVWLTKDEIKQVIEFIKSQTRHENQRKLMDIIAIRLLFEATIRVSEPLELTLADIKEDNHGNYYIEGIGKAGKEYTEYISPELYELIKEYYKKNKLFRHEYIFHNRKTVIHKDGIVRFKQLTRHAIYYRITKVMKKAIGKKISPHDLKRSSLMYYKELGFSIPELQRKGKHSNPMTTIKHYIGVDDVDLERKKKKVAKEIKF